MFMVKAALVGLLSVTDPTLASGGGDGLIENPSWAQVPDPELTQALFPSLALNLGISGTATVSCQIHDDGHPFRCRVIDESVPGLGFGSAARVIVASGLVRVRRIGGTPVPSTIRSSVHFLSPPLTDRGETWSGPEPTAERQELARLIAATFPEELDLTQDQMDGLDHDRRAVVGSWIEELIDLSGARQREVRTIQLARLFSEAELRGILEGRFPVMPTEEEWIDACPELTDAERAAYATLRDRYCGQFQC